MFALAVLITALNVVPPVDVRYRVRSEVVVSQARLQQLEWLLSEQQQHPVDLSSAASPEAVIKKISVLDRSLAERVDSAAVVENELLLVEVESLWKRRCGNEHYTRWLQDLTRAPKNSVDETEVARQARLARWELAAAEHYAAQHRFLSHTAEVTAANDGRTFQLGGSSNEANASLASHRSLTAGAAMDAEAGVEAQLQQQVAAARQRWAASEQARDETLEHSSGAFRLSGLPEVAARTSTIPLWLAASVLIVGVCAGATAGWVQHRLQSGGVYDARAVALQLQAGGLPVAGEVELSADEAEAGDWLDLVRRSASEASRRLARQLTRFSEWLLGIWCLAILARFLFDPLWRDILLTSPLAAFGRLVVGMP